MKVYYRYLHGKVRLNKRKQIIDEFNKNRDIKVFLVSLKSGGTALNLTGADYVVILDPWWNPAVEQQAIDRAYRIGQLRDVFAYRILVENSIEEKIKKLQEEKKELVDSLISEESSMIKKLDQNEIINLFDYSIE